MVGPLSSKLVEGSVIEVSLSSNRRRVAVAQRADGKRNWIVIDSHGIPASIAPKQVTFHVGEHLKALGVADLAAFESSVEKSLSDANGLLDTAWELLEGGESVSASDIATMLFGSDDAKSSYVAHCMLQEDRLYFKTRLIKGEYTYEPRPAALVTEARAVLLLEKERLEKEAKDKESIIASVEESNANLAKQVLGAARFEEISSSLKLLALDSSAYGSETRSNTALSRLTKSQIGDLKYIARILSRSPSADMAFDVLVSWGIFTRHENIYIHSLGLLEDMKHDTLSLDVAHNILRSIPADMDEAHRVDLRRLESYAIDSEETTEVDDAISWDSDDDRIWVHIADPTRFLSVDSTQTLDHPLLQEALRRVATLYLPTAKATMFPGVIAKKLFSLAGVHNDGTALSFGFRVLKDGDICEDSMRVVCAKIRRPIRITYEQADEVLLDETHDLGILYKYALLRRSFRESEGAITSNRAFCDVRISKGDSDEPGISLRKVETNDGGWTLVSELMISACTVAGLFAEDNDIPLIFRGQSPFDPPPAAAIAAVPEGVARNALMFKHAPPSSTGLEPMSHASLGVEAYVQVTSPIRRAVDLIAHLQLKCHVRKAESYTLDAERLSAEISRESDRGRRLRNAERSSNRYWQLEFIRRNIGDTWDGTVVRIMNSDTRNGLVHIEKYGFDVFLQIPTGISPGNSVQVVFNMIDARAGNCRGTMRMKHEEAECLEELISGLEKVEQEM